MGSFAVAGVGAAGAAGAGAVVGAAGAGAVAAGAAVAVADPPQNCALPTVSRCKLEKGP
jgi:hypothetical protein